MKDLCEVKTKFEDADFWIIRRGSLDTIGKPVKVYGPELIGVKVIEKEIVVPNYLFYWFQFIHQQGFFKPIANGTLRLVNIKVSDIADLPVNF